MKRFLLIAMLGLGACGAEGPPEAPTRSDVAIPSDFGTEGGLK